MAMLIPGLRLAKQCARNVRRLLRGGRALPLSRSQYKEVWNSQAVREDDAKMAVQGSASEADFRGTAEVTRNLLVECVGVFPTDTILEIGAGVGRVGRVLAPMCKEWIGADVSENMLVHLRRRLSDLPNVRSVSLNGYDLNNIPSASVDLVYCTVVFMHLNEWERYSYVREGLRVLKPGGRMLVDNFNLLSEEGWQLFLTHLNIAPASRPPHCSTSSTPQEQEAYFRRAGFQDVRQKENGLWIVTYGVKAA